jgi:hypothetical protein
VSGRRCECCDFAIEWCGKAAQDKERAATAAHRKAMLTQGWVPAAYPGSCVYCEKFYDQRTLIRHYNGPTRRRKTSFTGWIAECCESVAQR